MDPQLSRSSSQDTLAATPSHLESQAKSSKLSIDSFPSSASLASYAPSSSSTSHSYPTRAISPKEHYLDWVLKILGVGSAVLFGIWAPVSYRAQTTGNESSDKIQEKLLGQVERLGEDIQVLRDVVEILGRLRAWEVCEGRETVEACKALSSQLPLNSLLSDLIAPHSSHKPSSRRTVPSAAPTSLPTSSHDPTGTQPPKSIATSISTIPPQSTKSQDATPSHPHTRGLITPAPTFSAIPSPPGLGNVPDMGMIRTGHMAGWFGIGFVGLLLVVGMAIAGRHRVKRSYHREKGNIEKWG